MRKYYVYIVVNLTRITWVEVMAKSKKEALEKGKREFRKKISYDIFTQSELRKR